MEWLAEFYHSFSTLLGHRGYFQVNSLSFSSSKPIATKVVTFAVKLLLFVFNIFGWIMIHRCS